LLYLRQEVAAHRKGKRVRISEFKVKEMYIIYFSFDL
jgi:hypothetical protein